MQVFNLKTIKSYPYEDRYKNAFYKANEFKTRIIELPQISHQLNFVLCFFFRIVSNF